jgi:hypothetical protein
LLIETTTSFRSAHNAPSVASASLASKILKSESGWLDAAEELKELITFQLVGAEGDHDFLLKSTEMSCTLKCRPHVLYQRLCIYQHLGHFDMSKWHMLHFDARKQLRVPPVLH